MLFLAPIIRKCPSFCYNINSLNRLAKVGLSFVISIIKIVLVNIYIINQRFSRSIPISFIFSFNSLLIYILLIIIIIIAIYNFLVNKTLKAIVIAVL